MCCCFLTSLTSSLPFRLFIAAALFVSNDLRKGYKKLLLLSRRFWIGSIGFFFVVVLVTSNMLLKLIFGEYCGSASHWLGKNSGYFGMKIRLYLFEFSRLLRQVRPTAVKFLSYKPRRKYSSSETVCPKIKSLRGFETLPTLHQTDAATAKMWYLTKKVFRAPAYCLHWFRKEWMWTHKLRKIGWR